jgi:hypothetical protein
VKRTAIFVWIVSTIASIVCVFAGSAAVARPAKIIATGAAACGMKAIPLAVGNTWTWKAGTTTITLKVLEVTPGKDAAGKPSTVITVEETYQGRVLKNQLICTPDKGLVVPLESNLFTGEPGGPVGKTFAVTSRESVTFLNDAGLVDGSGWIEKVKADVTQIDTGGAGAKLFAGKLDLERHVHVEPGANDVVTTLGQWRNAQKIVFELRGRGEVESEKTEIPIKRPGAFYIVKGLGVVKIDDAFDKTWELVETNLVAK